MAKSIGSKWSTRYWTNLQFNVRKFCVIRSERTTRICWPIQINISLNSRFEVRQISSNFSTDLLSLVGEFRVPVSTASRNNFLGKECSWWTMARSFRKVRSYDEREFRAGNATVSWRTTTRDGNLSRRRHRFTRKSSRPGRLLFSRCCSTPQSPVSGFDDYWMRIAKWRFDSLVSGQCFCNFAAYVSNFPRWQKNDLDYYTITSHLSNVTNSNCLRILRTFVSRRQTTLIIARLVLSFVTLSRDATFSNVTNNNNNLRKFEFPVSKIISKTDYEQSVS